MSSALVQTATTCTTRLRRQMCSYIDPLVCHLHSFKPLLHVLHDYGDKRVHILTHSYVICTRSNRYYMYMYYTITKTNVFIHWLTRISSALVLTTTTCTTQFRRQTCSYIDSLVCHLHSFKPLLHVIHDYGDKRVHILTHSCSNSYYMYYTITETNVVHILTHSYVICTRSLPLLHVLHEYGDKRVHTLTHSYVICTRSNRYYMYYTNTETNVFIY